MENGTLDSRENHPLVDNALDYLQFIRKHYPDKWLLLSKDIEMFAQDGEPLHQVLFSTIKRIESGKVVSDRYALGLAWFVRQFI